MNKSGLTLLMLFAFAIAQAQDETHNITASEAKTLWRSSNAQIADTIRIDKFLRLALFNILKQGEQKVDLDTAVTFINKAEAIARRIKSETIQGYIASGCGPGNTGCSESGG